MSYRLGTDMDPLLDTDSSDYGRPEPVLWVDPDHPDCGICGEPADNEMGEFFTPDWPDDKPSVIAHAQCGIDAGLELA